MRMRIVVGAFVAGALLTSAAAAQAATRYATPTGSGPEPCALAAPCDIQAAVEGHTLGDVQDNDDVVLASGDYVAGSVSTDSVEVLQAIQVHGVAGQPAPRILTAAPTGVYVGNAGATLRGVTIEHTGANAALFLSSGAAERVYAHNSNAPGGPACLASAGSIRDSVCWNSTPATGSGVGFNFSGSVHPVVLRNLTAVSLDGYAMNFSTTSGGTTTVDARSVIASGGAGDVRANAATGATTDISLDHSNFATVTVEGTATATAAGTPTNQTAPPVFTDRATGDFSQAPASVGTIDLGVADAQSGSLDLNGDPRTLGAAPDIGADEFVPAIEPPIDRGDELAPETTITKAPKRKGAKRTARLAFSSNEPGSSFECRFDRAEFGPCVSPLKRKFKRGRHSFAVRAADAAGNVDQTPATAKWKVKRARR